MILKFKNDDKFTLQTFAQLLRRLSGKKFPRKHFRDFEAVAAHHEQNAGNIEAEEERFGKW